MNEPPSRLRKRNLPTVLLFGALLLSWVAAVTWIACLVVALGGDWREFGNALDPRGKPTDWWLSYCALVVPPAAILIGMTLAYFGRWRTALLVIPATAVFEITGGILAYAIDRGLI